MSHDLRCEHSKTPPRRCQCECEGRQHGTAAVRLRLAQHGTATVRLRLALDEPRPKVEETTHD